MKAFVAIIVGLLSCAVMAYSQQSPTSTCPTVESLKLPDESAKELAEYAYNMADSVTRNWNAPSVIATEERSAVAQVKIAKDGQVAAFVINSGDPVYDQAATDTIRRASPFAPLPVSAQVECIAIRLKFFHPPGKKVLVVMGGDVYRAGGGVSAPKVIFNPSPKYSKEARKAKLLGVCVLSMIITPDGKPRGIRVIRPLGMGLDEKALEAVKRWKFQPSMLDGNPVAVPINVEVTFKLTPHP